ncbi:MAG TPA: AAA family ATPase [Terriglobales bacterium]
MKLSGFRGFSQQHEFDLDADAVVVVGANGHGKTSLFDGILWALSGRIPRLHKEDARFVSLYSETGQMRVELRFKEYETGEQFTVTRSFDGKEPRVSLDTKERSYEGPSAEGRLIDLVWPDAASASDSGEALASVLTRSVYLQQDLIRQFIEAASVQERFTAVSELVGVGRVTALQANLEHAKKAWSTVTNQRQDELRPLRERQTTIEARLSELVARSSQASSAITPEVWDQWWQSQSALGLKVTRVDPASRDAPAAIDNAIKQLEALRQSSERRLQAAGTLKNEIAGLATHPIPDTPLLREQVTTLRKQLEELRRVATEEQARLADLRRQQAELQETTEQLKALAVLALKHLGDHCPVCDQTYDKEATKRRLETMANAGISNAHRASESDKLTDMLAAAAAKEKEVGIAESTLRSGEQKVMEGQITEERISQRLSEIGVRPNADDSREVTVEKVVAEAESSIQRAAELQRTGESLALRLAQSSAAAMIDELRREAEILRRENIDREKTISARNRTGELAQRVIEALRIAGSVVVEERLREISPLLQNIWARIDPHPAFRVIKFFTQVFRGKGELSTVLSDPVAEKDCEVPASVLSSSQLNALAVSVFLALNIGIPRPPLSVAILDDPLQSLDDINLLGLVDLFRQTKKRRQLFVSTHDGRFGELLARKLRPTDIDGRTIVIELEGWNRQGPIVTTREVKCDPVPLRLVS